MKRLLLGPLYWLLDTRPPTTDRQLAERARTTSLVVSSLNADGTTGPLVLRSTLSDLALSDEVVLFMEDTPDGGKLLGSLVAGGGPAIYTGTRR